MCFFLISTKKQINKLNFTLKKKERSFQTPGNTLTGESVVSLGTPEGNIPGRKSK